MINNEEEQNNGAPCSGSTEIIHMPHPFRGRRQGRTFSYTAQTNETDRGNRAMDPLFWINRDHPYATPIPG
jgi:hypothetical protein